MVPKNNIITSSWFTSISVSIFLLTLYAGCQTKTSSPDHFASDAEVVELDEFHTIVSYEDGKLSNPNILRFGGDSHFFVYDAGKYQVLELNGSGDIVNEYGRQGRGPGEFLLVSNIFLTNSYLYVVDRAQFRISRFKFDVNLNETLDYGKGNPQALPPAAPQSFYPQEKDINNQPVVTLNGDVLLSAVRPNDTFNALFELVNWNGKHSSDIGDIPERSAFMLDYDTYKMAIADQRVPDYYKPFVFPVSNQANAKEFYFIYSALPKIAKYNASGEKRWEMNIPETPELDSVITYFYDVSVQMRGRGRINLKKYVSGVSSGDGHLYLALGKYSGFPTTLWIHEFDAEGELARRYKLISEEVNLVPIFDIDFAGRRIFVVTEEAEIRTYAF